MILSPKEHGQNLDFSLLRAWTKPSHRTIQSQMAKSRQKIVMTFSAEGSGDQPFGGSDDRLDALLGHADWLQPVADQNRSRSRTE